MNKQTLPMNELPLSAGTVLNTQSMRRWCAPILALVFGVAAGLSPLSAAPTWDGNGTPDTSGNWSTALNWDTNLIPVTNDTVTLGDVTTGTRTVTFDSPSVTLQSLTLTQTTAGAGNILAIPYQATPQTLTVTNAMSLGTSAAGSTVGITITGPSTASTVPALSALGGLTVGTGGNLTLAFNATTPTAYTALTGNLTVSGGLVDIQSPVSGTPNMTIGSITANIADTGTTTISSGELRVRNAVGVAARLVLAENLNWSGGTIDFFSPDAGSGASSITLRGLTNTIGAGVVFQTITNGSTVVTSAPKVTLQIASGNNSGQVLTQTLASAVDLGNISFFEINGFNNSTYTHLITSTSGAKAIGQVLMASSGATNVFKLGSDLNSTYNAATFITTANLNSSTTSRISRIDLNGFTFNGTASTAGWTPNRFATTGGNLGLDITSSSGTGTLKATSFNFALSGAVAGDTLTVGNNTVLEATGGNASANILTGATATYTFNAGSTFRYSGTAVATNAATVTSGVAIGALEVQNGALKLNQASFSTGGGVAVSNAGTLDLNGTTAGALLLATNQNFNSTSGTLLLSVGDASVLDTIQGSGTGTFTLLNTTITLSLGSGFSYGNTYGVFSGFQPGSLTNVTIGGYDTGNYTATLGTNGSLSFAVIPEPATLLLAGLGLAFLMGARKRSIL